MKNTQNVAHLCLKFCNMFLVESVTFLQLFFFLLQLMSLCGFKMCTITSPHLSYLNTAVQQLFEVRLEQSEKVSHACIKSLPSYLTLHPLKQNKRARKKGTLRGGKHFIFTREILTQTQAMHVFLCLHKAAPSASHLRSSFAPS